MKFIPGTLIGLSGILGVLLIFSNNTSVSHKEKINGVSLVNPAHKVDSVDMSKMKRINASWVALIPFAFSRQGEPGVYFDHSHQWWGERLEGCRELVQLANKNGYRIMMKPHVWMREGWIGEFQLTEEGAWEEWEEQYQEYMLTYALLSEELGVELFCVGTEMKQVVLNRPEFWKKFIAEVREVYHGQLTYAANWDNYDQVSFWNQLDYVGVDAYFPLSNLERPDEVVLLESAEKLREELEAFSNLYSKPILFTEYGFRSARGGAGNHWEVQRSTPVDLGVQEMAYQALFTSFWTQDWFAGGFLWKWHLSDDTGGNTDNEFTPQNKPVELTIQKWYSSSSN